MRFVQISSAGVDNNATTQCNWVLHALDDMGRIWEMDDMHSWRLVPMPEPSPSPVSES